ncbi:phosphatase PAP2 family protein [Metabacillus sp. RGM 3146]|uniref:phosphatase PAP2 family protein n=1 Tax=Metabacillus sp. RGM 3146 TaxID=3401092 RepID=UPI003B994114
MYGIITGLLIFVLLGLTTHTEMVASIDRTFSLSMEAVRTPLLNKFIIGVTELGSIVIMLPFLLLVLLVFLYKRKVIESIFLSAAFITVRLLNWILKGLYERLRPSFHPLVHESTYSFPSGHAMNSTVFYSFLCFLIIKMSPLSETANRAIAVFTALFILLIGFTRIYLGVHYLTDVLAGFAVGTAWVLILKKLFYKAYFYRNRQK